VAIQTLDALYPIVYLDCTNIKIRDGSVRVKAVCLAIGINLAGEKELSARSELPHNNSADPRQWIVFQFV